MKRNRGTLFLSILSVTGFFFISGPEKAAGQNIKELKAYGCYAILSGDHFVMGNQVIERHYKWNNGNLVSESFHDKTGDRSLLFTDTIPDLYLPNETFHSSSGNLELETIERTSKWESHLRIEVYCQLNDLEVKRVFRIFPNTPAIQCQFFFRGETISSWMDGIAEEGEQLNKIVPYSDGNKCISFAPVMERIDLPGRQWKVRAVQFYDITDRYNTLVKEQEELIYRPDVLKGNLLIAKSLTNEYGLFILKEAPSHFSQLSYPGGDFITRNNKIQVIGIGVDSADLSIGGWIPGYGFVTGFTGSNELGILSALRTYQKNIRPEVSDEPVLVVNTWGDRSQDTRINEEFILQEIDACKRLGATCLQIDDGWQTGVTSNSAYEGGSLSDIWRQEDYWEPHPGKFPNGLDPVLESGRKNNIEISLWYNPSADQSYKFWEKDADVLSGFYHDYGVKTVKIDGLKMVDKQSEINIRKIFDRAFESSRDNMLFDLDVTAHVRFGYNYFNEYGVYWVTNRYTDWLNYYPYQVLRNTWMMSRYLPPEKLQMPFLNIWRNKEKYGDDPFAPSKVTFDYAFAITMVAQPMAFLESSGLPEEAFNIRPVVQKYLEIQPDLHAGMIFPIGEEPSGCSWTGFQSITNDLEGYLIIFRELNDIEKTELETWLPEKGRARFERIMGVGKIDEQAVQKNGTIEVSLPGKNTWGIFKYIVVNK